MSVFLLSCLAVFLVWAVWFYKKLSSIFDVHLRYLFEPDVNLMAKYPVGSRYDAVELKDKFWTCYLFGVFFAPIRLLAVITCCSIYQVNVWAMMKIFGVTKHNCEDFQNPLYVNLLLIVEYIFMVTNQLAQGFNCYPLSKKKHSIYDYIPDYEPQQDISTAAVTVSNHSVFFEIFFYWMEKTSFFSKASMLDVPFLGLMPLSKLCVFIRGHSKEDRAASQKKLKNRLVRNMKGEMPNITIFPEGTLGNGETIMKFKKGGFDHTYPIKIRCSRFFKDGYFTPSYANMNAKVFLWIWLSCPTFFNEFYEIEEHVDPLFLLKKRGVSPEDPDAWKVVAEEVKEIMKFMVGTQGSEQGYRDLLEYEKKVCYANDKYGGKFFRRTGCGSKKLSAQSNTEAKKEN
jgi:1-acyl-sn-glycerol-3-phosphate acyltransferase